MKSRGFTLVELIAIIAVLAAILLVIFPSFTGMTKQADEDKYNDMVDNLCLAGKSYIYANMNKFPQLSNINGTISINIQTLIDYGNIDKNIINPKTNKTIKNNILTYKVNIDYSLDCVFNG